MSLEEANRILIEKKFFLENWFAEVRLWKKFDVCHTRRTWIELFGFPPHGWKPENIIKIAEIWGDVVCLNEESVDVKSLEVACVLVDTPHMSCIDDEVNFHLQGETYRFKVLESRITVNTFSATDQMEDSEENTLTNLNLFHSGHSKTQDENVNEVIVEDTPVGDERNQGNMGIGPVDDHSSSSRTWSDVLMGRKLPTTSLHCHEGAKDVLANKVGSSPNAEQNFIVSDASDEGSVSREARKAYEVTKLLGLQAEEGFEGQSIYRIKCIIREEREERAST